MATTAKLKKLVDRGRITDPFIKLGEAFDCKVLDYPRIGVGFMAIIVNSEYITAAIQTTAVQAIEAEDDRHIVFSTANSTYGIYFYEN